MDKPYRMMKMIVTIEKDVHISCVEQLIEQLAKIGEVVEASGTHIINTELRFGTTKE